MSEFEYTDSSESVTQQGSPSADPVAEPPAQVEPSIEQQPAPAEPEPVDVAAPEPVVTEQPAPVPQPPDPQGSESAPDSVIQEPYEPEAPAAHREGEQPAAEREPDAPGALDVTQQPRSEDAATEADDGSSFWGSREDGELAWTERSDGTGWSEDSSRVTVDPVGLCTCADDLRGGARELEQLAGGLSVPEPAAFPDDLRAGLVEVLTSLRTLVERLAQELGDEASGLDYRATDADRAAESPALAGIGGSLFGAGSFDASVSSGDVAADTGVAGMTAVSGASGPGADDAGATFIVGGQPLYGDASGSGYLSDGIIIGPSHGDAGTPFNVGGQPLYGDTSGRGYLPGDLIIGASHGDAGTPFIVGGQPLPGSDSTPVREGAGGSSVVVGNSWGPIMSSEELGAWRPSGEVRGELYDSAFWRDVFSVQPQVSPALTNISSNAMRGILSAGTFNDFWSTD